MSIKQYEAWAGNEHHVNHISSHLRYQHVKAFEAGKYNDPVLNATQLRNRANKARPKLTGHAKAQMTNLIKLTKENPYLHRPQSTWQKDNNKTNYQMNTTMQRKLNLVYHFTQKYPDDKLSKWNSPLTRESNGNNFFSIIRGATHKLDAEYRISKDSLRRDKRLFMKPEQIKKDKLEIKKFAPWHREIKNINNAEFYTKQFPYVQHAQLMHQKNPNYSTKHYYLASHGKMSKTREPVIANQDTWKKFTKLQSAKHSPLTMQKPKPIKHLQFGSNHKVNHLQADRILNQGMQR